MYFGPPPLSVANYIDVALSTKNPALHSGIPQSVLSVAILIGALVQIPAPLPNT